MCSPSLTPLCPKASTTILSRLAPSYFCSSASTRQISPAYALCGRLCCLLLRFTSASQTTFDTTTFIISSTSTPLPGLLSSQIRHSAKLSQSSISVGKRAITSSTLSLDYPFSTAIAFDTPSRTSTSTSPQLLSFHRYRSATLP